MLTPRTIARRVRALVARRSVERELDAELRLHLELEAAALQAEAALGPEQARLAARRAFGGVERFKDEARDARGLRVLDDLERDVRIGLRFLRRQPAFTAIAALTLALGIGSTAAVFGLVHRVLFAPLPYAGADGIVTLWQRDAAGNGSLEEVAPANYLDLREQARAFVRVAVAEPFSFDWAGPETPEQFETALVTEDFFEVLGVRPVLGRAPSAEEFARAENVVVLSHPLWRDRFGGDSALLGRALVLDGVSRVVVGVMPRGAEFPRGVQMWAPKVWRDEERVNRRSNYMAAIARLRGGVTLDAARIELDDIAARLAEEHPASNARTGFVAVPLREHLVGDARTPLLVLMGAVGFVLIIACANVANLLLGRAVRRQREFAVRSAIGAGRRRIARQLLVESVLLGLLGGAGGVALAYGGMAAIRAFGPAELLRVEEVRVDGGLLLFALALAVGTALLFGLAPAAHALRSDLRGALAGARWGDNSVASRSRIRSGLVVTEVGLAVVLVVGAGLLVRSLASILSVDPGVRTEGVAVVTLQTWGYYRTNAERAEYVRAAIDRISTLPGVAYAGITSSLPFADVIGAERAGLTIDDRPLPEGQPPPSVHVAATTAGYFAALGIPLRQGRALTDHDDARGAPVAVVNETLARRFWPGESAVGQRITIRFQGPPTTREIVGVVGDIRHDGLQEVPRASVYVPHAQAPTGALHLVARGSGNPDALLRSMQRELLELNAMMPVSSATSLELLLARSLRQRRFQLAILGGFAGAALLLAAVGLYGVMSQAAGERTREIGIRMALGARSAQVMTAVLREGATLAAMGVLLGLLGAAAVARVLRGQLYGVQPLDPLTYAGGIAALFTVTLLACWLPARRAARLDPAKVLRFE